MRKEYDFTPAKKNPYVKKLKNRTTIRLDEEVIIYFQELAEENDIPYQSLINLYLKDCAKQKLKPDLSWSKKKK